MANTRIQQFFKTKMCPWYFKGQCERGTACRFAHSESELRQLPNLCRTSICPDTALLGYCPNFSECRYAHSLSELRATDDLYKTSLCFLWMRGRCDSGMFCRHAHGEAEIRSLQSPSPPPSHFRSHHAVTDLNVPRIPPRSRPCAPDILSEPVLPQQPDVPKRKLSILSVASTADTAGDVGVSFNSSVASKTVVDEIDPSDIGARPRHTNGYVGRNVLSIASRLAEQTSAPPPPQQFPPLPPTNAPSQTESILSQLVATLIDQLRVDMKFQLEDGAEPPEDSFLSSLDGHPIYNVPHNSDAFPQSLCRGVVSPPHGKESPTLMSPSPFVDPPGASPFATFTSPASLSTTSGGASYADQPVLCSSADGIADFLQVLPFLERTSFTPAADNSVVTGVDLDAAIQPPVNYELPLAGSSSEEQDDPVVMLEDVARCLATLAAATDSPEGRHPLAVGGTWSTPKNIPF